jgi:hypothetical protein
MREGEGEMARIEDLAGFKSMGSIAENIWSLSLETLGDFMDGHYVENEVLDGVPEADVEWLAEDTRRWVLDGVELPPQLLEWLDLHIEAHASAVLPDLVGMDGACWMICEDGIAGRAIDTDGGWAISTLAWEEIL